MHTYGQTTFSDFSDFLFYESKFFSCQVRLQRYADSLSSAAYENNSQKSGQSLKEEDNHIKLCLMKIGEKYRSETKLSLGAGDKAILNLEDYDVYNSYTVSAGNSPHNDAGGEGNEASGHSDRPYEEDDNQKIHLLPQLAVIDETMLDDVTNSYSLDESKQMSARKKINST